MDNQKGTPASIEDILQRRDELDRILRQEFQREATILFTDICGYTQFMDTHGDITGRAMLQRHNEIIHPLITEHNGRLIKTIGDAVMAAFEEPISAVNCAIAIQEKLLAHNVKANPAERIEVKIGINTGEALMDQGDLFGDAVNVASRIQSAAKAGEILISSTLYDRICGSDDLLCRYHDKTTVKGKAQPLDLYRVVWSHEDMTTQLEPGVRSGAPLVRHKGDEPVKVLQLEIAREGGRLKISAHEQVGGETSTVRHYEEVTADFEMIGRTCSKLVETLNKTNRQGKVSREVLTKLREIGQVLADDLFTSKVKETLKNTKANQLVINIDDQLVQIPWELLHDGKQFLCQRFSMGRIVKTRQAMVSGSKSRNLGRPLRMLVVADPRGDLKGAYQEGKELQKAMDEHSDLVNVTVRSDNVNPEFIRQKIRNFDLVHYAGHADYDLEQPEKSGWRLTDSVFTAEDIVKMTGSQALPALIFSNACQSARTEEWTIDEEFQNEIFGLANAFLLAGVKHYIGTFWEILDAPSRSFGLAFYKNLLAGDCVGEAMRQARMAVIREYGEETIVWASYMLYGDPTFNYLDHLGVATTKEEMAAAGTAPELTSATKRGGDGELIDFAATDRTTEKTRRPWLLVGTMLLVLCAGGWWLSRDKPAADFSSYEQAMVSAFATGHYEEAEQAGQTLLAKDPHNMLPSLVRGKMALQQGDMERAHALFQEVVAAPKASPRLRTDAFMGLGRIASIKGETDNALDYYQKASTTMPDNIASLQARAMLLGSSNRNDEALTLFDQALGLAPGNRTLAALAKQTRDKVDLAKDQAKQERIDTLVQELLASQGNNAPAPPSDNWTSRPLTAWIMEPETTGHAMQEGTATLINAGLADRLLEQGKVQLVERAVLDKLLAELKLASSNLADQRTALALGRLLAARLIMTGTVIHNGPETTVSLRLIETETGRIMATVSETFPAAAPADLLVEKLAAQLQEKIDAAFPLRGRISVVEDEEITLNIGSREGVLEGGKFTVSNGVATLEVIAIQADTCLAKVVEGEKQLMVGLKVEGHERQEESGRR